MPGELAVLNVGSGDAKLTFDKNNPAETLRAGRIIKDMLRRGYALLVEVDRDGVKAYERATDFDADTCEYIIADFDSEQARKSDMQEAKAELKLGEETDGEVGTAERAAEAKSAKKPRRGRSLPEQRRIDATQTSAVSVARSAGG